MGRRDVAGGGGRGVHGVGQMFDGGRGEVASQRRRGRRAIRPRDAVLVPWQETRAARSERGAGVQFLFLEDRQFGFEQAVLAL